MAYCWVAHSLEGSGYGPAVAEDVLMATHPRSIVHNLVYECETNFPDIDPVTDRGAIVE